ncbi:MAG: hypothetical protein ACWGSQ_04045, partial [Longimicrobiales bacterium]
MPDRRWFNTPFLSIPTLLPPLLFFAYGCSPALGGPGMDSITVDGLKSDVFTLADDEFLGREAGTLDELRAAAWVAERARESGLEPAGEDGSYFQFFPLRRTRVSDGSVIEVGGNRYEVWQDAIVLSPVDVVVEGAMVWVGETPAAEVDRSRIQGRPVAAMVVAPSRPPAPGVRLWEWRYSMAAVRERSR